MEQSTPAKRAKEIIGIAAFNWLLAKLSWVAIALIVV
jgi:hypothetical protein